MKRLGCRLKTFIFLSSFFLCVTTESNIMFMKQETYPQALDLCQMFLIFIFDMECDRHIHDWRNETVCKNNKISLEN